MSSLLQFWSLAVTEVLGLLIPFQGCCMFGLSSSLTGESHGWLSAVLLWLTLWRTAMKRYFLTPLWCGSNISANGRAPIILPAVQTLLVISFGVRGYWYGEWSVQILGIALPSSPSWTTLVHSRCENDCHRVLFSFLLERSRKALLGVMLPILLLLGWKSDLFGSISFPTYVKKNGAVSKERLQSAVEGACLTLSYSVYSGNCYSTYSLICAFPVKTNICIYFRSLPQIIVHPYYLLNGR